MRVAGKVPLKASIPSVPRTSPLHQSYAGAGSLWPALVPVAQFACPTPALLAISLLLKQRRRDSRAQMSSRNAFASPRIIVGRID